MAHKKFKSKYGYHKTQNLLLILNLCKADEFTGGIGMSCLEADRKRASVCLQVS